MKEKLTQLIVAGQARHLYEYEVSHIIPTRLKHTSNHPHFTAVNVEYKNMKNEYRKFELHRLKTFLISPGL